MIPRPEACGPARADDPVDFADAIKQRGERLGVGDVDPLARMARGDDALAGPERLDDLSAEEPSAADDEKPAQVLLQRCARRPASTFPSLSGVRKASRATASALQPDEIAPGRGALALVADAAQRELAASLFLLVGKGPFPFRSRGKWRCHPTRWQRNDACGPLPSKNSGLPMRPSISLPVSHLTDER